MEGQGVAASSSPAAGTQAEPGPGAVVAADVHHPGEDLVTRDIADGGEDQEPNGDDGNVMVAPGHPEASAQDINGSPPPEPPEPPPEPPETPPEPPETA